MKKEARDRKYFLAGDLAGMISLAVIVAIVFAVFILPIFLRVDAYSNNLGERLQPPSSSHLMGTDQNGRDVFARIIYGGRISLIIGLLTTLATFVFGVGLGLCAGVVGGTFELAVVQLVDISFAVPSLLLAIAAAAVMEGGVMTIVFALSLSGWGSFARISRGAAKQIMTNDYVLASRSLGGRMAHVVLRHVLPNAMPVLIVTSTLKIGSFILGEAALSFLGLGINPPEPSWGGMVSESYRFLQSQPWLSVFPGIMIALLVTAFNLLGDSLRDHYDVKKDL